MPGKKFIDATIGEAGHAKEIIRLGAEVLGIDRDPSVVQKLRDAKFKAATGNFGDLAKIAEENDFISTDGILFDLGIGSHQLDSAERGFSFQKSGPLDMRFDTTAKDTTAETIINHYSEKDLIRIFLKFGEEKRFAKRIARAILERRQIAKITNTDELFELIKKALPGPFRHKAGDAARRIFQSLRIAVNNELENLEKALPQAVDILNKHGRLVVISFHSLEDRIVKNFLNLEARDCVCPPEFPECVCDKKARLQILTRKPVVATDEEIAMNSRARSAKMRAAKKV